MFPTMAFQLAYDALNRWRVERADVEYVHILHIAATIMESTMDSALTLLLRAAILSTTPRSRTWPTQLHRWGWC